MSARKPPARRAQHSSESAVWGTGRPFVDVARATLGKISVDPFSSAEWNRIIAAERFIDERRDGYATSWAPGGPLPCGDEWWWAPEDVRERGETALVNYPGDSSGATGKRAWCALVRYREHGWLAGGAVWVAFSLNQLQTLQRSDVAASLCDPAFLRCVPDGRAAYESAPGVLGKQPPHPSALVLLPALNAATAARQREIFTLLASRLGAVF